MNVLEEIKEMLYEELVCVAEKGQIANGSTLEVIDKLTHSLKSIDTIIAMEEYGEDEGYARRSRSNYSYGMNSRGGRMIMNDGSYGGYNRMGGSRMYRGRYSREDSKEKILEKLEDYMDSTGSEKVRDSIKKVMEQISNEE